MNNAKHVEKSVIGNATNYRQSMGSIYILISEFIFAQK